MKTIGELIQLSTVFLKERGVERASRLVEQLLAHTLGVKRLDLYLEFDKPIEEKEFARLREPLKRLTKGEPIEYVLGEVDFFGCRIGVDGRVLIPRPETEILVEHVLKRMRGSIVWDVCTGSGCIGVALKKARPELEVSLSDLSREALELAVQNARQNGVEVKLVQGDLLTPFQGQKADVIICNPPYVSTRQYLNLQPSVRNFEPIEALVGGDCGTEFYERLAKELPSFLKDGGQAFLEIGSGQGAALQEIFSGGGWNSIVLEKDWAGHDRFFFLEKGMISRVKSASS